MSDADGLPQLAERLNHLFATIPRAAGEPLHSNESAAAAITAGGYAITGVYIGQMRSGKRTNPSARHLAAIAELFGVPVDYFFNPETATRINAELDLLLSMRDAGIKNLAMRAHGLSEESLDGLAAIIDRIKALEQQQPPPSKSDQ